MRAIGLALVVAAVACRPAPPAPSLVAMLAQGRWVDLSYAFDSTTIYWPTAQPFRLEVLSAQRTPAGYYYAANNISAAEHGGTHLDSPVHFAEGRNAADQVPLERLIGPAVVVDVTAEVAAAGADYQIPVSVFEAWERANGEVRDKIVLVRTGWGSRYPDRVRYLGSAKLGPEAVPELHFPGIHPDAARWLKDRRVRAVGIDTPSIDYGQSTRYETHQTLYAENIPGFENVASLDALPAVGAWVVALPMKIARGSGGPLRIVAWIPTP